MSSRHPRPSVRISAMLGGLVLALVTALPMTRSATAQTTPPATAIASPEAAAIALTEALQMGPFMEIMRDEGLQYGRQLEDELFAGRGGIEWQRSLGLIYDPQQMLRRFTRALANEIPADSPMPTAAITFFGSDLGKRILGLEIEARRALLDEATEDAARAHLSAMEAAADPRLHLLRRFAEANDLIEANVQGALNANLAFYRGMAEAGALGETMSEEDMLADVWGQEADIRAETTDWLFPYLALAYGPLTDEELDLYIAFSLTAEGKSLNVALFSAFDAVFGRISFDLGRASALQMIGQDI